MDFVGPEISLCPFQAVLALIAAPLPRTPRDGATLGPTTSGSNTFVQTVSTFMGSTSDFQSLVRGRFGGTAADVSVRQVVSFAPTSASGRTNETFAANPPSV